MVAVLFVASLAGLQLRFTGEAHAATHDGRRTHNDAGWLHILQVIATLKASPPKVPVVYLLGGSSAVDSTVSDKSWATQVRRLGHRRVRTYNFGSTTETYARDLIIVNHLPALPSIVLIGVNLGRYSGSAPNAGARAWSADMPSIGSSRGHGRSAPHIFSDAQKRAMVLTWLETRYPLFKHNFAGNTAQLVQLIAACQRLDLHPVLLELPLNLPIVGHALKEPRIRYRDACRALAKKCAIPKIDFLNKVHLVSGDFRDLFHLVEPGRVKWQLKLSKTVVSLLDRCGMGSQ
jgi:hypothetical protein